MHDREKPHQSSDASQQPAEAAPSSARPAWNPMAPASEGPTFVFIRPGHENEASRNLFSDEFAGIIDQKIARGRKKQRISSIVTLFLLIGVTFGGLGWFVSDPGRINALTTVISEIRSAGDFKSIVAKYQKALDKVAVRGDQIDEATGLMGGNAQADPGAADAHFDQEMREMAGPNGGPTVAGRNAKLVQKFGHAKDAARPVTQPPGKDPSQPAVPSH